MYIEYAQSSDKMFRSSIIRIKNNKNTCHIYKYESYKANGLKFIAGD